MKNKFLLPLIGIISLGSVALPITSCACGKNEGGDEPEPESDVYEINEKKELEEGTGEYILQSKLFHVKVNTEIKFEVKWSDLKSVGASDGQKDWMIFAMNINNAAEYDAYIAVFDETKYHFFLDGEEQKNGEIYIDENHSTIYPNQILNLQDNSIISGSIVISQIEHFVGAEVIEEVQEADMRLIATSGT